MQSARPPVPGPSRSGRSDDPKARRPARKAARAKRDAEEEAPPETPQEEDEPRSLFMRLRAGRRSRFTDSA